MPITPTQQNLSVMDGTTGAIKTDVDGNSALIDMTGQPELISLSIDDLVHILGEQTRKLNAAKSEAGRARKKVQDIAKVREGIVNELVLRDAEKHGIEMNFEEETEEEDGD
jgi:hypothetical protein